MRGSGKTTKVYELVAPCRRLLVADPTGLYQPPDVAGYQVVFGQDQLAAALRQVGAFDRRAAFRIIYRDLPGPMRIMAPGAAFAVKAVTLVLEELAWFCSASHVPPHLQQILSFGREPEINLVGTTRRAQEVNDMLFSEASLAYLFYTKRGLGLERLRHNFPDVVDELAHLKRFEYRLVLGEMGATEKAVRARLGREGT